MSRQPTVFLVDPDGPTRDAIKKLTSLMDLHCEAFVTGQEFLADFDQTHPGCVLMEIKVPGINGLQIQLRLRELGITLPVIFISSGPSVSIAVHAMRSGALHFLEKPVRENDLWNIIQEAMQLDDQRRQARLLQLEVDERAGSLTEKEHAVLEMIADGHGQTHDRRGNGRFHPNHRASSHAIDAEAADEFVGRSDAIRFGQEEWAAAAGWRVEFPTHRFQS